MNEEGERVVGQMGSCVSCCLKTVLCRKDVVPAGWRYRCLEEWNTLPESGHSL